MSSYTREDYPASIPGNGPIDPDSGFALDIPFGLQDPAGWWMADPELLERLYDLREAMGIIVPDDLLFDPWDDYAPLLPAPHKDERPAPRTPPRLKQRTAAKRIVKRGEDKAGVRRVRDPEFWGLPYGTPITSGMKPQGKIPAARVPDKPAPKKTAAKKTVAKKAPASKRSYKAATHKAMYTEWSKDVAKLDKPTRDALTYYGETGYEFMNAQLRGQKIKVSPKFQKQVEAEAAEATARLTAAMRPVGKDLTVHRFADVAAFKTLKPGDTFTDNGFASTSIDRGMMEEVRDEVFFANDAVNFTIQVPKETRAFYLSAILPSVQNYSQQELVLAPGTSYRVVSRNGNNVTVEVVNPS